MTSVECVIKENVFFVIKMYMYELDEVACGHTPRHECVSCCNLCRMGTGGLQYVGVYCGPDRVDRMFP